ncbi:MAG: hypothetical protein IKV74_06795 [Clostridia bacterium]|nr:hypothetical protein [Clostridia bacterium]
MATVSFQENLEVNDVNKIKEIARALKQPTSHTVQSAKPEKLPKDAGKIWFKH